MSSIAQITANRANAQLSTGPTTEAGIAACKFNAIKHSLTGKQIVTKGEDPAEYNALRAELHQHHAPANPAEAMQVEEISQNWWRLQRARRVLVEVENKYGDLECIVEPEAIASHQRITRYVAAIERSWNRALNSLDKLQKARRQKEEEAAQAATFRLARKQAPVEIGSVLSKPETAAVSPVPTAADVAGATPVRPPTGSRVNG